MSLVKAAGFCRLPNKRTVELTAEIGRLFYGNHMSRK